MKDLMQRLTSRKFLLAALGGLLVFANSAFDLGLSHEEMQQVISFFVSFIAAEGIADVVTIMRKPKDQF